MIDYLPATFDSASDLAAWLDQNGATDDHTSNLLLVMDMEELAVMVMCGQPQVPFGTHSETAATRIGVASRHIASAADRWARDLTRDHDNINDGGEHRASIAQFITASVYRIALRNL